MAAITHSGEKNSRSLDIIFSELGLNLQILVNILEDIFTNEAYRGRKESAMSQQLTFDEEQSRAIEAIYLSERALARRKRALELVGIDKAHTFLDLGCGPGFLLAEAAEIVGGSGEVHAVDSSDNMLAMAQARAGKSVAGDIVHFHSADAAQLPLPDAQFDAAAVIQVYEYVSDMPAALAELHRVLKPGGQVVIIDTDWDTLAFESLDPALTNKIFKVWEGHLADPSLPRSLCPLLETAGFEVSTVEPLVQFAAGKPDVFANALLKLVRDYVVGKEGLTEAQVDEWAKGMKELADKNAFFWSICQFMFVARRL